MTPPRGALSPEQAARQTIDALLSAAGWAVQNLAEVNLHAARGVAIREFPLVEGHGTADYLLYVDGRACGVIEAKKQGATLTGVEIAVQSAMHKVCLPACPPGAGRCRFSMNRPASKPTTPTASIPSRARVPCSPSIGPRRWRRG